MKYTLTPEQFESKRATLAENGVILTGDSGTFNTHGFSGTFTYDGTTLDVEVQHEPFFFTAGEFYDRLTKFMA